MAKWKCEECGAEFDDPKEYEECVGEFWGSPAYMTVFCCPNCSSEEIDEVEE